MKTKPIDLKTSENETDTIFDLKLDDNFDKYYEMYDILDEYSTKKSKEISELISYLCIKDISKNKLNDITLTLTDKIYIECYMN